MSAREGGRAPPPLGHLWVVGAGRTGLSVALRLARAGAAAPLSITGRRPAPPAHPLFAAPAAARWLAGLDASPSDPDVVLIAVPDAAISGVAARLAALPLSPAVPVLHTSGSRGREALALLAERGHPTGSAHPLAALADPVAGADRLEGATWGIEGEGAALDRAAALVAACGGRALRLGAEGKALYHAAAVFASNYAVALLSVAERLMEGAGVVPEEARPALAALASGAVGNVAARGPAAALTGPVARGEVETVALHLARLSADERRLYCLLGREALRLADEAGADPATAESLAALFQEDR